MAGMEDTASKDCACETLNETQQIEYGGQHASNEMFEVKNTCALGCTKYPCLGLAGTKTAEPCEMHTLDGMVYVKNNEYISTPCTKKAPLGMFDTRSADRCERHANHRMFEVSSRNCRTTGSDGKHLFEKLERA